LIKSLVVLLRTESVYCTWNRCAETYNTLLSAYNLEKPTVELRKNILRNKIHRDGLQFPPEVIDYIAENVKVLAYYFQYIVNGNCFCFVVNYAVYNMLG